MADSNIHAEILPQSDRSTIAIDAKRDQAAEALVSIVNSAAAIGDYRAAVAAVRTLADLEGLCLTPEVASANRLDGMTEDQRRARLAELEAKAKSEADTVLIQ